MNINLTQNKGVYFLISFYALCLGIAGFGHALDIWNEGWMPYSEAPTVINLYWTLLAPFDILAAGLLYLRPRHGFVLMLVIMVSDVLINSYATYSIHVLDGGWALQLQSLFLGFVLGGAPYLWMKTKTVGRKSAAPYA